MAKKVFDNGNDTFEKESIITIDENSDGAKEIREVDKFEGEKNLKINILQDVDCSIGNTEYKFEKGKQVSVPTSVANILCNSGKACKI